MELAALLEISGLRMSLSETTKSSSKTSTGKGGAVSIIPAIMRESDGKFWSDILRTQRKIPHLLQTEGTLKVLTYHRHVE
jgi:hypothetical protein